MKPLTEESMENPEIEKKKQEIIEAFRDLNDWEERFQLLIELGEELPPYPENKRKDEYLVPGCQSRVWVCPRLEGDRLYFDADSDTSLTKGLIAILVKVLSGHTAQEISECNLDFLETIGLKKFLSINRRNGLHNMIQLLKQYAEKN